MPPKAPKSPTTTRKAAKGPQNKAGVTKPTKSAGSGTSPDAIFMYRVYLNGGTSNWAKLAKDCNMSVSTAQRWFARVRAGFEEFEASKDEKSDDNEQAEKTVQHAKPAKKNNKKSKKIVEDSDSEDEAIKLEDEDNDIKLEDNVNHGDDAIKIEDDVEDEKDSIKLEDDVKSESPESE